MTKINKLFTVLTSQNMGILLWVRLFLGETQQVPMQEEVIHIEGIGVW